MLAGIQVAQHFTGRVGIVRQHQLQVAAEGRFNGTGEFVGHADLISQRANRGIKIREHGLCAFAETLVAVDELLKHIPPGFSLRLALQQAIQLGFHFAQLLV